MLRWLLFVCALLTLSAQADALRVGFGVSKPPYVFEEEGGGLELEVVGAAMRAGGLQMQPYYAPLARLDLMMRRGELDVLSATLPGTLTAYFSESYLDYYNVVVALASRGLEVNRVADLQGLSVSAFQRARFRLGDDFQRMAQNNLRYREEPRQAMRNNLLFSGRVEAVVGDLRIIRYFIEHPPARLDVEQPIHIYRLFPSTHYRMAFRDAAARDAFDRGLQSIRDSGEYARILERYPLY